MNRQRKYQLSMIAKGLCPLCGKKKGVTQLCPAHRQASNLENSERKKRHAGNSDSSS